MLYDLAFHLMPSNAKAIVLLLISLPLVVLLLIMVPGHVAGAIYLDKTMIIDLVILGVPFLIVGGGLMVVCTFVLEPRRWRGMLGVLLALVGAPATLAFLVFPVNQLTSAARVLPQEAALLAVVLEFLCGPLVVAVGIALVLIQMRRGARAAHLHNHEPPPA